nr:Chain B, C-terminal peptide of Plexin-B1 [synthetic construct]
VENKVTDL